MLFNKNPFKTVVLSKIEQVVTGIKDIQKSLKTMDTLLTSSPIINVNNSKTVDYLIHYHWWNEITASRGDSSAIISLKKGEKMTTAKLKKVQDDLLKVVTDAGHPGDPTNLVVVTFTKLEV